MSGVQRAVVLAHRMALSGGSTLAPHSVAAIRTCVEELAEAGVEKICVVDGDQAEELAHRLELGSIDAEVIVLANRGWRHATGSALLRARDFVAEGPCLVIRGDRPIDVDVLRMMAGESLGPHDGVLAISTSSSLDSAGVVLTRVGLPGEVSEISTIGFDLESTDGFSAGIALVNAELLPFLEALPNPSIEEGMAAFIADGALLRAKVCNLAFEPEEDADLEDKVEALLDSKAQPRYTLLNPGPVNTTARVKSALVHHDVCHRDSSFSELMVSLSGKLRRIFRGSPQHSVCLVTGSGTAAMECALSSCVPRGGKILVVDNGAFGQRLLEISQVHEMEIVHLRYAWGDAVQPKDVERALRDHPDIAVVAMIHHETSVGLLNPVREVGELCRQSGALFVVDAVSSLGAEDIDVVRDHVDICYASANKCLHAVSGVGFLCVAPRVWNLIANIKPRSYYLDLKRYRRYADENAQTPFTPAVSAYFALDAACSEFLVDGRRTRLAMYQRRNKILRRGLSRLGMAPFTRTGRESNSVVTACVPDGVTFEALYEALKTRGYIIYGCKDVLAGRFLQVANMGDLDDEQINLFLLAVEDAMGEVRRRSAANGRNTKVIPIGA